MSKIVLIGTSHPIQRDKDNIEFSELINESIAKHGIQAIAEEIDVLDSVVSEIAHNLNIDYRVIEPNEQERAKLGIDSLNQIANDIFMKYDDDESPDALAEGEERKQSGFRAREQEWMRRIDKITANPILVVCGANHVSHFSQLLRENTFDVVIESSLWQ